ncbi:MAG: hypothetical protein OK438_04985 [Thaumarchaeota archaeon]|nr:hypothetical protein [Nitrososphaerota archaeon]
MTSQNPAAKHGLAFLTLLSFLASFLAARAFTTLTPATVVVTGGIHFHHFWYGLIMVVAAGWLAIVTDHPELDRIYAIVFGLGGGLIGDEVGLLLTLGDYQSELTYVFFVGILSFAGLSYLILRYREQLAKDVVSLGRGERLLHFGIFIAGVSSVAWAFGQFAPASVVLVFGLVLVSLGLVVHRRKA